MAAAIAGPDAMCDNQHCNWGSVLTPVQAVPAKAQAKGSRYQGDMAMAYMLRLTDASVMATALHARKGLMSNTCRSKHVQKGYLSYVV